MQTNFLVIAFAVDRCSFFQIGLKSRVAGTENYQTYFRRFHRPKTPKICGSNMSEIACGGHGQLSKIFPSLPQAKNCQNM